MSVPQKADSSSDIEDVEDEEDERDDAGIVSARSSSYRRVRLLFLIVFEIFVIFFSERTLVTKNSSLTRNKFLLLGRNKALILTFYSLKSLRVSIPAFLIKWDRKGDSESLTLNNLLSFSFILQDNLTYKIPKYGIASSEIHLA